MPDQLIQRRKVLTLGAAGIAAALLGACGGSDAAPGLAAPESPDEALAVLQAGNSRYASFSASRPNQSRSRREEVASGQKPWAVVWGCIDSRVAPELLFDVGLGDLFIVRTAGQAIDATSLGSAEFGVAEFEVPLVLVLGHERCGAVTATRHALESHAAAPGAIGSIVEAIRPAFDAVRGEAGDAIDNAIRANVRLQVSELGRSPVFGPAMAAGRLRVSGAVYDLDTGLVDFDVA